MTTVTLEHPPETQYTPAELLTFCKKCITPTASPEKISPLYKFVAGSKKNSGLNAAVPTDKLIATLSFINGMGYNDRLNYSAYAETFRSLVDGKPNGNRTDIASNLVSEIAQMDKATLARFGSFIQSQERMYNGFFLRARTADGTLAAVVARVIELGPNKAPQSAPVPVAA